MLSSTRRISKHRAAGCRAAGATGRSCFSWRLLARAFRGAIGVNAGDPQLDRQRPEVLLRGRSRKERIVPIPNTGVEGHEVRWICVQAPALLALSRKGWWRRSGSLPANEAMALQWFAQLGLISLQAHHTALQSAGNRRVR
jgi:hypothetical protein